MIILAPRARAGAVEDIIGGEMNERRAPCRRPAGNGGRSLPVDPEGEVSLVLGAIDRGICGRIDDQIRREAIERCGDIVRPGQIEKRAVGGNNDPIGCNGSTSARPT